MSSLVVASPPRSNWSIGSQWVGAYVAGQVICVTTAAAVFGIATFIGANDPAATGTLKGVAVALAVLTELIFVFAITTMRGLVLRQVLPAFPIRLWVVVVAGAMMALYALSGASSFGQATARANPEMTSSLLMFALVGASFASLIVGLIFGAIEAMVIRRAADGAIAWALITAVGWSAGTVTLIAVGGAVMLYPGHSPAATAVLAGMAKIAGGAVVALATLPALKQLRPRS
jgi:hypothetical protein